MVILLDTLKLSCMGLCLFWLIVYSPLSDGMILNDDLERVSKLQLPILGYLLERLRKPPTISGLPCSVTGC
jgi:hypothetical protein